MPTKEQKAALAAQARQRTEGCFKSPSAQNPAPTTVAAPAQDEQLRQEILEDSRL